MEKDSEKSLEAYLVGKIAKMGGVCFKNFNMWTVGYPDRVIFLPGGRTIFVELKSTGFKPRPIQKVRHEKLRKLGYDVRVIDNFVELKQFINEIQTAYIPEQSH